MINLISEYILFFFLGVIIGRFGTLLFFRLDKTWKQLILGAAGAFSTGGMGKTFISYLSIQKEHVSGILLTLIIGLILSVYISFKKIMCIIKRVSRRKSYKSIGYCFRIS